MYKPWAPLRSGSHLLKLSFYHQRCAKMNSWPLHYVRGTCVSSKRSPHISGDVSVMSLVDRVLFFLWKTLFAACQGLNVKDEPVGRRWHLCHRHGWVFWVYTQSKIWLLKQVKRDTLEIHSEKRVTLKTINNISQRGRGWGWGVWAAARCWHGSAHVGVSVDG